MSGFGGAMQNIKRYNQGQVSQNAGAGEKLKSEESKDPLENATETSQPKNSEESQAAQPASDTVTSPVPKPNP